MTLLLLFSSGGGGTVTPPTPGVATMPSNQPSAALVGQDITAGNGVLWYSPSFFTSFSDAKQSTKWRKMGMMKSALNMNITREYLDFVSGLPAGKVQSYITSEAIGVSGDLLEGRPSNVARILGGVNMTRTVKTTSPAPTTLVASSTKTLLKLTSAAGYAPGDEVRVGSAAPYQYGRIKTISGNDATLFEGLDLDVIPTTGDAVAKVDETSLELGNLASPAYVALKLAYTLIGGYGKVEIIIPKVQFKSSLDLAFQDNTTSPEGVGFNFTAEAIKDADVENGAMAQWVFTQTPS